MTLKTLVVLVACAAVAPAVAAARTPRSPPRRHQRLPKRTHKEDANTVEVDEGMLRDLRITTRDVESRPAESSSCSWRARSRSTRLRRSRRSGCGTRHAAAGECRRFGARRPDARGTDESGTWPSSAPSTCRPARGSSWPKPRSSGNVGSRPRRSCLCARCRKPNRRRRSPRRASRAPCGHRGVRRRAARRRWRRGDVVSVRRCAPRSRAR